MIKKELTDEQLAALESELERKGYFNDAYHWKCITTKVACPVCGMPVVMEKGGNSYRLHCSDETCFIYTARGL